MSKLSQLNFTLTGSMACKLLDIANLKHEISLINEQLNEYKNTVHYYKLLNSKEILEEKVNKLTKQFINEFKKENILEIELYNAIKKGE